MHAMLRRQPWITATLLGGINRFRATPRRWRIGGAVLLTALLVLVVSGFGSALHHRPAVLPVSLRWWLPAGFAAWTSMWARRRSRFAIAAHRRGWMQAWPLPPRKLMLEQAALAAATVLAVAIWPAIVCGLLMRAGANDQSGLNLAGCCLGVLVGVGLARWPAVEREALAGAASLTIFRDRPSRPFVGMAHLREWQRRAIGRLSLRRWVLWMAPVLMMAPSWIGVQAAVQILLLLAWPLHARAMAASLESISDASRLLAATPLRAASLLRHLLPRTLVLSLALAVAVVVDLAWLGFPARVVAAGATLILLFEGIRMASRCRYARNTLTACVRPAMAAARRTTR